MKIGILVNESKSIFTNGCLQQGYFLLKSFRKLGYSCNFLSASENFTKFEVVNEDVYHIKGSQELDKYNLIVFSSGSIDNSSYMSYCKLNNIKMVNLCVGNYYVINQEEFVFGVHKSNNVMKRMFNTFIDRIWLMPMYSHNMNYMKYITKKPLDISPYVWDSTFIDEYCNKNGLNLKYNPQKNLLDIVILEPNVSIHKTALVPLLICEAFYNKYPNKLGKVYLFCKPSSDFIDRLWHLNIFKNERVEFFQRVISMDLFNNLNNLGKKYVVLSSNIRNGLNFLHLECFKLGIPIIHNCKPFKTSGLYYQEDDIKDDYPKAIENLLSVYDNNYTQNAKDILDKYNPHSIENIDNYKNLVDILSKDKTPILKQIINNLSNQTKEYKLNSKLAVVFMLNKKSDLPIINRNITFLTGQGISCIFYVTDQYNILDSKPTDKYNVVNLEKTNYRLQEIYSKILHRDIILVDSGYTIMFNILQMVNNADIVGIEIESDKDLTSWDYEYYKSMIQTVELIIPKNNDIKLFDLGLLYIKNSENIINGIKSINRISSINDLVFSNIIFHIYYQNKISLIHDKVLIYSEEQSIVGKGYSNNSSILFYKSNENIEKKQTILNDKLYKFIDY